MPRTTVPARDAEPGPGLTPGREGRSLGLVGATGIGVGAIVGGGILALAGVAFVATGPGAMVAFAINGVIALVTALSFAELAASFPESGGTYTFAKKVMSVNVAFLVGWVVWFASIVAAALYALGFGAFAAAAARQLVGAFGAGAVPTWMSAPAVLPGLAALATVYYAVQLLRRPAAPARVATVGKVVAFAVLIAAGLWALGREGARGASLATLLPLFPDGGVGLLQAMGYTFIALQGFDLIAAVGGEVRDPGRTIPRAMVLSLAIALAIYLPLLLVVATVGVPAGETIRELAAADPETVVARAAATFLGPFGYWLVIVAAVLSMLSALQANLLAASHVAQAMARDRTLPRRLGESGRRGTPAAAVAVTAGLALLLLVALPDVAAAGAAASLIFLVSFALAHLANVLARRRGGAGETAFRLPLFPLVPLVGGLACLGLALFQGLAVPSAGGVAAVWLGLGAALYFGLLAPRAAIVDAASEALDPDLVRLRGRSPLVLAPIANPERAAALVEVASALAPPRVGRVLLLSVVRPPEEWRPGEVPPQLADAEAILHDVLATSFAASLAPEALIRIAGDPWQAITDVAAAHRCESLLLGFGRHDADPLGSRTERLMSAIDSDVVVLRSPRGWRLGDVQRVLVPVGGRDDQSRLRARLLGSLARSGLRDVTFLGVARPGTPEGELERTKRELEELARDEVPGPSRVEVQPADDVAAAIAARAATADLTVLGLRRLGRRRKAFGELARRVLEATDGPVLLISRRG